MPRGRKPIYEGTQAERRRAAFREHARRKRGSYDKHPELEFGKNSKQLFHATYKRGDDVIDSVELKATSLKAALQQAWMRELPPETTSVVVS